MIAGDLRSKIDRLRDALWSGGISDSLEVIKQITYLPTRSYSPRFRSACRGEL